MMLSQLVEHGRLLTARGSYRKGCFCKDLLKGGGSEIGQCKVQSINQVAQLWQKDCANSDAFSINVQHYSQNHAQN